MAVANFKIKILPRAKEEINEICFYYESKSKGLGKIFYTILKEHISTLKNNPFFENKYNIIRVLPLKKFPYSIHFCIDEYEKLIYISAIISDHQNPSNTRIKF